MILGIISDTHDRLPVIDDALNFFKSQKVDLVIHCGDWKSLGTFKYFAEQASKLSLPVKGVLGNNDLEVTTFLEYSDSAPGEFEIIEDAMELQVGDRKAVIYHGHHKPTLHKVLSDDSYDMIFLGHTHKPRIEKIDTTLFVNPGSTAFSIPRSKVWVPTVAIVDSDLLEASLHVLN